MTETLSINIDSTLKRDVEAILESIGLDFTTAIHVYFKQIAAKEGLPLNFNGKRYYTIEEVAGKNWEEGLDEIEDEWE